jgi:DNA-binding response OmpR family regulator
MSEKLLVVDDDQLLVKSLSFNLRKVGYEVYSAGNAEEALIIARQKKPDLVLLDINLPGMDGLDALHHLRDTIGLPVIFVTARRRDLDQVLGLEMGADDYVTKPFDIRVLLVRIKAVLRRTKQQAEPVEEPQPLAPLQVGKLTIDPFAHTVMIGKQPIVLTPREFEVLYLLAEEAGKLVTSEDLLEKVWGIDYRNQLNVIYTHIRWLREKLETDPAKPRLIQTVHGLGYKLVPQED